MTLATPASRKPTLTAREVETYQEAWALESYRAYSPGARFVDVFATLVPTGATVLDAGCGDGQGMAALVARGYTVVGCDLVLPEDRATDAPRVTACLWHDLMPVAYLAGVTRFDAIYCTDVLEHVPTPFTMLVVQNLLRVTIQGVFLTISLVPDAFGAWIGRPLHQTVQGFPVWRDQLRELGTVQDARDLGTTGLYWVTPR